MGSSQSAHAATGQQAMEAVRAARTPRSFFLDPQYGFPVPDDERLHPERYRDLAAWRRRYATENVRRRTGWMFVELERLLADRGQLKKLVRRGIPAELRPQVWFRLSGAAARAGLPGDASFRALVEDRSTEYMDRSNRASILKDVDRTFVQHSWFGTRAGQDALRRCLLAFVHHEPETGYLQSMNVVMAQLLLFYADEEPRAFWMFQTLVTTVLPPDFYHKKLVGVQVAGQVFARLLQLYAPKVHRHLERNHVQARHVVVPWFATLFVGVLPAETAMRVWDCLMLEGSKILFRVALGMFMLGEKSLLAVEGQGPLHRRVTTMGLEFHDPDALLERAFGIVNLSRHAIEQLRLQWLDHVVRQKRDHGVDEAGDNGNGAGDDGKEADGAAQDKEAGSESAAGGEDGGEDGGQALVSGDGAAATNHDGPASDQDE